MAKNLSKNIIKFVRKHGGTFEKQNTPPVEEALAAMRKLTDISQANGNSQMTLDEIIAEINASRKGTSLSHSHTLHLHD